jgi:response regulator RpfG family c-di-GMP phosphodiesterase
MTAAPSSVRVRRAAVAIPDAAVSLTITRHLGRRGFELVEATSLDELLAAGEALGSDAFAIALLDVQLPGGGGADCIARFHARWPETVAVLVAPGSDEQVARSALAHGAASYLLRPFGLYELDGVVGRALARLELAELKRLRAERPGLPRIVDFELLPADWLHWGDERSAGGVGHGYRVARMAKAIAAMLPGIDAEERWPMEFAARAHELGWLHGPAATEVEMAVRTATMLQELGVNERVVHMVRSMFERWDGSGGPAGSCGHAIPDAALVLGVADRLDHAAVSTRRGNGPPERAIGACIGRLLASGDPAFAPHVLHGLAVARPNIEAMWALATAFPEH